MKNKRFLLAVLVALLMTFTLLVGAASAEGQNGTTLSADVTANAHLTLTYHWTIDKSVAPATWDLFKGDSGTSEYTVSVTKDAGTLEGWLDGQICVTNGGGVATENLAITAVLLYGAPFSEIASAPVDVSSNPVLDPLEVGCYDYHVDIPAADIHVGGTYKVTAEITITNHSGSLGTPFGPNPSATAVLPVDPVVINGSINVDDTNGGSWLFSDSGSVSYTQTFACNGDSGTHNNTATIRETGQNDSASVTVNCYSLSVTKDASTSFTRTYNWSIDKTADQSSLTLALDQQFTVNYSVTVDVTGYIDSLWAVDGNIAVHNPAPMAATLNSVTDAISGVGAATVDCAVTFPYSLAAGGTLNCTYSAPLPDATDRTNTATATLQNYDYDKDLAGTASGTTDFTGNADVLFSGAAITYVDTCVNVTDSYAGTLGTVCVSTAPHTFNYSRTVGPYSGCGTYTVDNIAYFTTNDTETTGNDSWKVDVNVPCGGGCTLTIGYWKTHAGFGPQDDMVTPLLPQYLGNGAPDGLTVNTAEFAVQLLNFYGSDGIFSAFNGINKLYAQLLGAKLNIAAGANDSAISGTISDADAFLTYYNSPDWFSLSKNIMKMVLGWVNTLDNYNNGFIGPGHCSQ